MEDDMGTGEEDVMMTEGTSSKGEKISRDDMDIDSGDDSFDDDSEEEVWENLGRALADSGPASLKDFCKQASILFFKENGLISHQINSYNDYVRNGLQKTLEFYGDLNVDPSYDPSKKGESEWRHACVKFGKVTLEKPSFWSGADERDHALLPRHARLQNMTYSAKMKVNVTVEVYIKKVVTTDKFKTGRDKKFIDKEVIYSDTRDVTVGTIPVMVKSDLCWMKTAERGDCEYDEGGYFLIKGAEKVFIAQEQICLKRLWISNIQDWTVSYKSQIKRHRLIVRLEDIPDSDGIIRVGKKGLTVYFLSTVFPLWTLFFALGVASDKEAVDLIDYGTDDSGIVNFLLNSIYDADMQCAGFRRQKVSTDYVLKKIKATTFPPAEGEDCFSYLFPSLASPKQKARFLGYMVKCLLQAFCGKRKCDNRDSFRNKRFELAGELLDRELRVHLAHSRRRMAKVLQRDLDGDREIRYVEHYLDASIISNGLTRAFSTGAWSHQYKRNERISGVVGNLGRQNPLQTIADMRRTRQQVQYTGKVGDARYPHPSHWGRVCFLSTPDGENCGLVKNLAATGLVSTDTPEVITDQLIACGMEKLVDDTRTKLDTKHKIFVNGEWVGVCDDSFSFVTRLRRMRRRKKFNQQIEIKRDHHHQEVRIFSDAGRILRPLLVVENVHKIKSFKGGKYTFQNLMDKGIIELVGIEEEEDCRIAWDIRLLFTEANNRKQQLTYTHTELDMSLLLGLSCGIIPFANHDHARRVLYQSQKHCQQAIGFPTTNPNIRVDTLTHQLYYPQRPLFRTFTSECLGKPGPSRNKMEPKPELYNGQNSIVAVNVHMGYNQEDSLVMNRASLERGMFRSEHIRTYKADVDNNELKDKRRKVEDAINFGKIQSKIGRVDSLEDDGFPFIGANLQSGDIVIGRCAESGADHSIKLKHTERGMVQKVVLSSNDEGKNYAAVSLRQVRSPCLGDKFSSMHGQKGVLGYLESQENFPFTRQGIVPDVVINPHAFPSRQTPGQLLEAALGKGIACGGLMKGATPFSTLSVEAITDQLHRAGFQRWGNERVYNGRTGEMVKSLIFMGPTFYQRLIHMAEDKVKFRNTGPVHPLTRQPVADRKRFGGIKFGEMERDCLIAHGAAANLHERLFTLSDSSQMHVCQKCQNVANVIQRALPGGRKVRGPYCRFCESADEIVKIQVPYGAKLLCQELFSMGINLKYETRQC
ncbi:DNA-directed RNA polymerases IV and V subunit 2-like [Euphorbia lathyris]|uniref:DNA-directed RNA polymerases IV and V subunit 2-like n=1 Tax=Euphorbia lathyris TaxID=212925 RepID=UPI0033144A14